MKDNMGGLCGYNISDTKNNIGESGRRSLNLLLLDFTNLDKNELELNERSVSPNFLLLDFTNFVKDKPKLDKRNVKKK